MGKEENINVQGLLRTVTSCTPQTADLACNRGMCPAWESNWQTCGPQTGTRSPEPHQPGRNSLLSQKLRSLSE